MNEKKKGKSKSPAKYFIGLIVLFTLAVGFSAFSGLNVNPLAKIDVRNNLAAADQTVTAHWSDEYNDEVSYYPYYKCSDEDSGVYPNVAGRVMFEYHYRRPTTTCTWLQRTNLLGTNDCYPGMIDYYYNYDTCLTVDCKFLVEKSCTAKFAPESRKNPFSMVKSTSVTCPKGGETIHLWAGNLAGRCKK